MIAWLSGKIKDINDQYITLEHNGIGFGIYLANTHHVAVDQTLALHIHLHWNQDQGPTLFGFISKTEKEVFLLITTCPGIGPKIALSIIGNISTTDLLTAIHTRDINALTSLNGIGKKKAEQIILHLSDKINALSGKKEIIAQDPSLKIWKELADALNSLNYSRQEIADSLAFVKTHHFGESFDQQLRKALSFLSKRK